MRIRTPSCVEMMEKARRIDDLIASLPPAPGQGEAAAVGTTVSPSASCSAPARAAADNAAGSASHSAPCSVQQELPAIALSIRQPWAWLIIHAGKDIENRNWPTRFRGRFAIHASKGMTRDEYWDVKLFCEAIDGFLPDGVELPSYEALERGGIVGEAEIVDCVTSSPSPWFFGEYGFVLRNAKPLPFVPVKGSLGFFRPEVRADAAPAVGLQAKSEAPARNDQAHPRRRERD